MSRRLLAALIIGCVALGCMYAIGVSMERGRWAAAKAKAEHESDSLRAALTSKIVEVHRDTVRVVSVVTRWRSLVDTVAMPARPETLTVERVVRVADSTIATVDQSRRQCLSVLSDCERTALALTTRAEIAEAHAAVVESAAGRAARWRSVERGVCAGSLLTNWLLVRR